MRYTYEDGRVSKGPALIDWMYRYEPVLDCILQAATPLEILDFGCGNNGLGAVYAEPYYGIDLVPIRPAVPNMIPIDGVHPFELERQFDLVCAMDVLEHIPVPERPRFFDTLKRISRKWVVFSYPTIETGRLIDIETLAIFSGGPPENVPDWLVEHLALEPPDPAVVTAQLERAGLRIVKQFSNTNRLFHYLGCIGVSVEGMWKIKLLNDIHLLQKAWEHAVEAAMYRQFVFAEV